MKRLWWRNQTSWEVRCLYSFLQLCDQSLKVSEGGRRTVLHFGRGIGNKIFKSWGWNKKGEEPRFFEKIGGGTCLGGLCEDKIQLENVVLVSKYFNNMLPSIFGSWFAVSSGIQNYITAASSPGKLFKPSFQNNLYGKNSKNFKINLSTIMFKLC